MGSSVNYAKGYSATQPFGTNGFVDVDARTGLARYLGPAQGTFLMAVDVDEYRTINGREVLPGTLRRDIQVVRTCSGPSDKAPFTPATLARKGFHVEEGQNLNFNIAATDPEGQAIGMNVSSVLLDGAGGVDATLNGQMGTGSAATLLGSAAISGTGGSAGLLYYRCWLADGTTYKGWFELVR